MLLKRKLNNQKAIIFFIISVLLTTSALARLVEDSLNVDLQANSIEVSHKLVYSKLNLLKKKIINGITFKIIQKFHISQLANNWYKFSKVIKVEQNNIQVKYDHGNHAFLVLKNKKLNVFQSFDKVIELIFNFQTNIKIDNPKFDYQIQSEIKGESMPLYFPLDIIYRSFLSDLDFSISKSKTIKSLVE